MKISKQSRRDAKTLFSACRVDGLLDETARRTARVENAVETTPAQVEAIKANLERQYGSGLNISFWVNPALIGGLRIKVGSDIYDGSVAGRLAEIKNSL